MDSVIGPFVPHGANQSADDERRHPHGDDEPAECGTVRYAHVKRAGVGVDESDGAGAGALDGLRVALGQRTDDDERGHSAEFPHEGASEGAKYPAHD